MRSLVRFFEKEPHPLTRIEFYLAQIASFCRSFTGKSGGEPWIGAWSRETPAEMSVLSDALRKSRDEPPSE